MASTIGKIIEDVKTWISSRVYIGAWDLDEPDEYNYQAYDGNAYPSNIASIVSINDVQINKTYMGVESTLNLNISFCFRYLREFYQAEQDLPISKVLTLYGYLNSLIILDKSFINYDLLEVKQEGKLEESPLEVKRVDDATPESDWLVYLKFKFNLRFVCHPHMDYYKQTQTSQDIVYLSEVMPPPAGQVGTPINTGSNNITPMWRVERLDVKLKKTPSGELEDNNLPEQTSTIIIPPIP